MLYETLYHDGSIVAVHADIDNREQTISYPVSPDAPRTGDAFPIIPLLTLGILSLLSLISIIRSRHKS